MTQSRYIQSAFFQDSIMQIFLHTCHPFLRYSLSFFGGNICVLERYWRQQTVRNCRSGEIMVIIQVHPQDMTDVRVLLSSFLWCIRLYSEVLISGFLPSTFIHIHTLYSYLIFMNKPISTCRTCRYSVVLLLN